MGTLEFIIACIGLAAITVITRGFFMIPDRELPMPEWLKRGLKYAPLAALMAVIAPEILMTNIDGQHHFLHTLLDARLPAVIGAAAFYLWKRGVLGTIVVGMVIYMPLHMGLGW